jgi:hypothetical protein
VGTVGVLVAAFLPWARSGLVHRNAFRLARAADRLDLVEGLWARALLVGYVLMPVVVALTWTAAVLRRRMVAAACAAAAGVVGVAGAIVVLASRLRSEAGPRVSLVAGLLALAASGATVVARTGSEDENDPTPRRSREDAHD